MNKKRTDEPRKKGRVILLVLIIVLICVILLFVKRWWDTRQDNSGTAGERAKFEEMIAQNPEVIAWLTVDDTKIDTAITQTDNNMKYLNTDVYGESTLVGNPFLDYRNAADFSDGYSIIYGHHVEDHLMFTDLELFTDPDFWEEERTATLWLADGTTYRVDLFACLTTTEDDSRYFDPIRVRNNWNEEFLTGLTKDVIVAKDQITTDDRILTLSTCKTADTDERILVMGKLEKRSE